MFIPDSDLTRACFRLSIISVCFIFSHSYLHLLYVLYFNSFFYSLFHPIYARLFLLQCVSINVLAIR